MSWIPVLLSGALILLVWLDGSTTRYEPRYLLFWLNATFLTMGSLLVSVMAARTALAGGTLAVLPMGAGMLALGLASLFTGFTLPTGRLDAGVAVYNIGSVLAGAGQLLGAIWLLLPMGRRAPRGGWGIVLVTYGLAAACILFLAVFAGRTPLFILNGESTPLRLAVLTAAVVQFALAGLVMLYASRRPNARFLRWYGQGALLMAMGLMAVALAPVIGGPLNWAGRSVQYVGGVYLLIAVTFAVRQMRGLVLPLRLLEETHQRYSSLVQMCPDAILVHSGGRWVFANGAGAELFGAEGPEALLGREIDECTEGDAGGLLAGECSAAGRREMRLRRLDGSTADVDVTAVHVEYDGEPSVMLVLRDITQSKRAEDALKASEARFRQLADAMPQLVWTADADGQVDYYNIRREEFGTIRANAEGHWDWGTLIHPDDRAATFAAWQRALSSGGIYQVEHRVLMRDGSYRWHLSRGVPARDERGQVARWFGTATDVHALRESEQRYHSLFDGMTEGFAIHELIVDDERRPIDYRFIDVNAAFERLTGLQRERVIGRLVSEVLPDDYMHWVELYAPVALNGEAVQLDRHERTLKRHYEVFAYRPAPMQFAVIFMDITQRKEMEAELRRASAAKDRFIAALSHELRTPLTPVLASVSELMHDKRLPADVSEDLRVIERNIGLEVNLINDLLDVTRIVSGKFEVHSELVEVPPLLREVGEILEAELERKGHTLAIDVPQTACWVRGDRRRLQQVFWNLINNAIKFSPPPSQIHVTTSVHGGMVRVDVRDRGCGLDEVIIPRLFLAFEQGSAGGSLGGLGLGLTICKGIVELHGGTINARNADVGAVFTVELPMVAAPDQTAARPAAANQSASSLRILLVEDHHDSANVVTRLLRADTHEVVWASSVSDALDVARQQTFDVLVSDLGLPDGTGYDLMRQLRAAGNDLKGIAVSGYGSHHDIAESLAAGFSEHLTKPLSFAVLRQALHRVAVPPKDAETWQV